MKRKVVGHITFSDEIIDAVVQKTGFTKSQVSTVFGFIFLFIRKEIKDPNRHSLYIPHIGTLYLKIKDVKKDLKNRLRYERKTGKRFFNTQTRHDLEKQVEKFDALFEERSKNNRTFIHNNTKSTLNKRAFRKGLTLEELESKINSYGEK